MKAFISKYYPSYMYLVGFIGQMVFVFQAYKIFQTGSSADVSLWGFGSCFWAVASWLVYGFVINNQLLIRVNLFGVCAGIVCLAMIVVYQ